MKYYSYYEFPIGTLGVGEDGVGISHIFLPGTADVSAAVQKETPLIAAAAAQLREYFAGERKEFDLPLAPQGTAFQRRVWEKLCEIPYGECRSYGDLAGSIGNPKACRAVGMANHRNPLPIFIPCHRVVGANGNLVGYAGGLDAKTFLLELETE